MLPRKQQGSEPHADSLYERFATEDVEALHAIRNVRDWMGAGCPAPIQP